MKNSQSPSDENGGPQFSRQTRPIPEDFRRLVRHLAAIHRVSSAVSQSLELETTLQTAVDAVLDVILVKAAGISLVDEEANELVLRAQHGWKHDFVKHHPMRIPLGVGMSGLVVQNDEVLVTGDVTGDPRLWVKEFAEEGIQAMAMAPMHAQGRVVGILSVMNYEPYEFSEEELAVLRAIADQVGVALHNAHLYQISQEQSSRLSAVLHSSGDGIIATDSRGNINLVNSMAESLFALRPEELIGQPLRQAPLPLKLREGLRGAMSNKINGYTTFEIALDNGRYLSAVVSPVYSPRPPESDQETEGWVVVVRDVTHLHEAEQTRIQFIHAAAHDLRNPLSATLGALTMLENDMIDQGTITDTQREVVTIGLQSVDRMQDLIDSLLNLEHIESGIGLQEQAVDIRDVIERALIDVQFSVAEHKQALHLDVPKNLPAIRGDSQWLYRAITNLLSNANKYTGRGGEITVRAYLQDEELVLEVQDNGPGIPRDVQSRLFERFYRAPSTDARIKGSGLGLAIVKSVAEQHGGRVFVQSQIGQGSIFGMILPMDQDVS